MYEKKKYLINRFLSSNEPEILPIMSFRKLSYQNTKLLIEIPDCLYSKPDEQLFSLTKLKVFADDISNVSQMILFFFFGF